MMDTRQRSETRRCCLLTQLLLPLLSLNAPPAVASKKQQGMYDKWRTDPAMFALLKAAVINACTANACVDDILLLLTRIPRTTMRRHKAAFQEAAKQHSIPLSDVKCHQRMIFPIAEYAPLLTADDCKFLAMRDEIITMIMEMSQCVSRQQATNHNEDPLQ